jgi:crooked neck
MPENVAAWKEFAALEQKLNEAERCRAIFELAIAQPHLDMPEQLWKSYIDFEIDQQEYNNVRSLYQKLLQRTQHVKVWVSYAQFESSVGKVKEAREVFSKAFNVLKQEEKKEERVVLVESWVNFEVEFGDEKSQQEVMDKMPRRVTKRRKVITETGQEAGWEEYYDYIFPDEEAAKPNLKLLEAARKWKQQQAAASSQ